MLSFYWSAWMPPLKKVVFSLHLSWKQKRRYIHYTTARCLTGLNYDARGWRHSSEVTALFLQRTQVWFPTQEWFTTIQYSSGSWPGNSSSRESDVLFWPLWTPDTHVMHTHKAKKKKNQTNKIKWINLKRNMMHVCFRLHQVITMCKNKTTLTQSHAIRTL